MDTAGNDNNHPHSWLRANFILILLLCVSFAIITCYFHHYVYVSSTNPILVSSDHFNVVTGKAEAPMQYRIAPYFMVQAILSAAVKLGAPNNSSSLILIYFILRLIITTLAYLALLSFLSIWFDMLRSLLGLCFLVAVNPLAEYQYYHQPGDPWLLLFFILGYIAIVKNRVGWLLPIIFFAVPFHEAVALLIPAYIFSRVGKGPFLKPFLWTILLCAAWMIPYFAIRAIVGPVSNYMENKLIENSLPNLLTFNFTHIQGWVVLLLLFNVLWIAVPAAWKKLPHVVRRMFFMVPIFIAVYLVYGRLIEGRHFIPLIPLFLVAGLTWLDPSTTAIKKN